MIGASVFVRDDLGLVLICIAIGRVLRYLVRWFFGSLCGLIAMVFFCVSGSRLLTK